MYKIKPETYLLFDSYSLNIIDNNIISSWKTTKVGYLKRVLKRVIFQRYTLKVEGDLVGVIFLKSPFTVSRKDYNNSFQNIFNSAENASLVEGYDENEIDIVRSVKLIGFITKVFLNERKNFKGKELLVLLGNYIVANDFLNEVIKYDFSKINLAVVYYDVIKWDYLFVQYMKSIGVKTATLQHAAFIAPRKVSKPNFEFEGLELCNSTSDLFLAWNPFTKDEALKAGMKSEKIKVLGIPKYAYFNREKRNIEEHKCFGVILNAKSFDTLNRCLIKYADYIAEKYEYSYFLKYHPQFMEFEYDNIPKSRKFKGHVELSMPVTEYCNLTDFSLVSNSSLFIELVFLGQNVLRLQSGEEDKFRDVTINAFSNEEELDRILDTLMPTENMELFDYLCYTKKPEENYSKFFKQYV